VNRFFLTLAAAQLFAVTALAHKPSDSYLRLTRDTETLHAEWDIALADLELVVGLDDNQDGEITWAEVETKQSAIAAHALGHLRVSVDGVSIEPRVVEMLAVRHSDGAYAVLRLDLGSPRGRIDLTYSLLFDVDPTHRGLVRFADADAQTTHVLSREAPTVELGQGRGRWWNAFAQYTREGVWHIWIGYDHVLFLIALLLPSVLVRRDGEWVGKPSFAATCHEVFRIVTMFTLAHSVTLWLSVTEYVRLPSQWVEATIALSIVVTALANLLPKNPITGWKVAFFFGLVHGFGFANVLVDLGLSSTSLGIALFGFNVGVELGQIAIVLALLPVAFLLRNTAFYRVVVLWAGSLLLAAIATVWFCERAFNVSILSL
jgi:hypothetical protein